MNFDDFETALKSLRPVTPQTVIFVHKPKRYWYEPMLRLSALSLTLLVGIAIGYFLTPSKETPVLVAVQQQEPTTKAEPTTSRERERAEPFFVEMNIDKLIEQQLELATKRAAVMALHRGRDVLAASPSEALTAINASHGEAAKMWRALLTP